MLKPLRNESVLELNIRAHYIAMEPTPVVEPIPAGEPTPEAEPNLAVESALQIDPNPVVPILAHMTVTPFPIPTPAKSGIKTSLLCCTFDFISASDLFSCVHVHTLTICFTILRSSE